MRAQGPKGHNRWKIMKINVNSCWEPGETIRFLKIHVMYRDELEQPLFAHMHVHAYSSCCHMFGNQAGQRVGLWGNHEQTETIGSIGGRPYNK